MDCQQIIVIILQYSKYNELCIHNAVAPGILHDIGIILESWKHEIHRLCYVSCHCLYVKGHVIWLLETDNEVEEAGEDLSFYDWFVLQIIG